jgi:hypothetical protein
LTISAYSPLDFKERFKKFIENYKKILAQEEINKYKIP